jgi:CheY-like chemotaxis protein
MSDENVSNEHDPRRVLIIDDDPQFREEITEVIEESQVGWDVKRASDPAEALRLISADGRFDCVFLDLDFPGSKSGIDFLRDIRHVFWAAPIYILTNFKETAGTLRDYHTTSQEIRELGAIDWFEKSAFPDFHRIDTSISVYRRYAEAFSGKLLSELQPCLTTHIPEVMHGSFALQSFLMLGGAADGLAPEVNRSVKRLISSSFLIGERLSRMMAILSGKSIGLPSLEFSGKIEVRSDANAKTKFGKISLFVVQSPEKPIFLADFSAQLAEWLSDDLSESTIDQKFFSSVELIDEIASTKKSSYLEAAALTMGRYFADRKHTDLAGAAVHSAAKKILSSGLREVALRLEKVALGYAQRSGDTNLVKTIAVDLEYCP